MEEQTKIEIQNQHIRKMNDDELQCMEELIDKIIREEIANGKIESLEWWSELRLMVIEEKAKRRNNSREI